MKIRSLKLPNFGFRKGLFIFRALYIFGYPDFLAICMLVDAFFWHLKVCSKVKSKPTFYWYEYLMTWNLNADLPWKLLGQDKRYKFPTAETNFSSNFEKNTFSPKIWSWFMIFMMIIVVVSKSGSWWVCGAKIFRKAIELEHQQF